MTLQIELTPEIEAKLRKQAAEAGKDVASIAREAIEESISLREEAGEMPPRLSRERRVAEFLAWAASHRPLSHVVDDSRESIYEGCGE